MDEEFTEKIYTPFDFIVYMLCNNSVCRGEGKDIKLRDIVGHLLTGD
jgi:hypothetical protein